MKRGNFSIENVSKLNTFVLMSKSNELLALYINKIANKKCKTFKFMPGFDCVSLDLLYTSLKIMNNKEKIDSKEFNKLDKEELKYYISKLKGMKYFTKQVSSIKNEMQLISYLKKALTKGEYVIKSNSTVRFDNGLVVDSLWLVDFINFIVNSLNMNESLSLDGKEYVFRTVELIDEKKDFKNYLKGLKIYEYKVRRNDKGSLKYKDLEYLINVLSIIDKYDFNKLKDINAKLSKEGFTLSVSKVCSKWTKDDKVRMEKMFIENEFTLLEEYVRSELDCFNTNAKNNKKKLLELYENLRVLSHAYMANYSIDECRKLFNPDKKDELLSALAIADYYIYYIYDEDILMEYFNYEMLELDDLKPAVIDYETLEYKYIIGKLSDLNKKVVTLNKKINKCLCENKLTLSKRAMYENSKILGEACKELEDTVANIKEYREKLNYEKNTNLTIANINKTKIRFIKDAIIDGLYSYNEDKGLLVFDSYNDKDYHQEFHLEIKKDKFINILLSDKNRNLRINYY